MFWDTADMPFDSEETKEKKKNRRRSNFYEEQYEDLSDLVRKIKTKLTEIDGFLAEIPTHHDIVEDHTLKYKYNDSFQRLQKKVEKRRDSLYGEYQKANARKSQVYDIYIRFRNRG
jgi:hypothetical protein